MIPTWNRIESLLGPLGLLPLGWGRTDDGDVRVLIGNAGPDMWQAFASSPEAAAGGADPLNRWSRRVVDGVASRLGGHALYPFEGPPYHPFQDWALSAGAVTRSPLGLTLHPVFGLWHAYCAALVLERVEGLPDLPAPADPCATCADRPCLTACPVGAFDGERYDVPACRTHVAGDTGDACLSGGCLARHACPIGQDYAYEPDQATFHMKAFLGGL